ncbi:hypothetical protein WME77_05605 [Sorangium sp. So ce764]
MVTRFELPGKHGYPPDKTETAVETVLKAGRAARAGVGAVRDELARRHPSTTVT